MIESPAIQKFKYLLQKHFMTGYPHSLKRMDGRSRAQVNFVFITKMANLNSTLNEVFKERPNLFHKYAEINFSLFNKAHLETMQKAMSNRNILSPHNDKRITMFT